MSKNKPAVATQQKTQTTKKESDAFDRTMTQVHSHLSVTSRLLSTFIHVRAIEFLSDILAGSLFRPTAIVCGSSAALIFSSGMYAVAKHYGYELAGSEFLVAFCFGWVVGIIVDYVALLLRSITKKHR